LVNVPIRFTFPEANRTYAGANTIARPRWAQAPTYADVLTAYPSGLALDGRITFDCRVQPEGTLGDCRPVSERNQGAVERSARTLLSRFRLLLDPAWDPKGRPIRVNVPIRLVDPTSPQAATRALSGPPPWVAMPSAQMLASAYPREAREKGLATGRGVIDCEVAADGALANCSAASATPEGAGFAEAALRVAKELRLNLWTSEGGPVVGARIRLPISFEAETTPPKP
jgi:TonB family protein